MGITITHILTNFNKKMKRDKSGRFVAKRKKRTVGRLGGRLSKRENLQIHVDQLFNRSAYVYDQAKQLERVALRPSTRKINMIN